MVIRYALRKFLRNSIRKDICPLPQSNNRFGLLLAFDIQKDHCHYNNGSQ